MSLTLHHNSRRLGLGLELDLGLDLGLVDGGHSLDLGGSPDVDHSNLARVRPGSMNQSPDDGRSHHRSGPVDEPT